MHIHNTAPPRPGPRRTTSTGYRPAEAGSQTFHRLARFHRRHGKTCRSEPSHRRAHSLQPFLIYARGGRRANRDHGLDIRRQRNARVVRCGVRHATLGEGGSGPNSENKKEKKRENVYPIHRFTHLRKGVRSKAVRSARQDEDFVSGAVATMWMFRSDCDEPGVSPVPPAPLCTGPESVNYRLFTALCHPLPRD